MKEIALYALLNGIQFTANLHGLEKATIKAWIRDLDFDRDPFFVKLRNLVIKTAKKIGIERTCTLFEFPRRTLEILMQEFGDEEVAVELPAKRSKPSNGDGKEAKMRALKMHIKGKSTTEISLALQIGQEKITKWVEFYEAKKREKKIAKKEEAPVNVTVISSDSDIDRKPKVEEIIKKVPDPVNLEEIQEIDPFDLMFEESIKQP
ncbi:unnamed protein product [Blepharisma stoltei]|uniref:Transposase n=1 Tax=Blepharisma stoltei TaxID=1481888 RepID=A0AAU9JGV0_9CILI|nr:unnamed protein product [Blepharisma stoltei]